MPQVSATGKGRGGVGLWALAREYRTVCQGVDSAEWDGVCSCKNGGCLWPGQQGTGEIGTRDEAAMGQELRKAVGL